MPSTYNEDITFFINGSWGWGGRGEGPGDSWWECAARFSKSWPYFRPKKSDFPHPFSDLVSKKLCHHCLDENAKKKISYTPLRIRILLLLSNSFGVETTHTFIHLRSFLDNHTRFQTKMAKFIPVFRPKRRKNPTRRGGTYLCGLYKESPPPPSSLWLQYFHCSDRGCLFVWFCVVFKIQYDYAG